MNYLALGEHALAIAGAVVMTASGICALTRTPDPSTRWGKAYHAIEVAGILIGRAKEDGLIPDDPGADQAGKFALDVARDALGSAPAKA